MSEQKPPRRTLQFSSHDQVLAEIATLRKGYYARAGTWSLPQICAHLAATINGSLEAPDHTEPTPEESAMKQKFFGMVFAPGGMPTGLQLPPEKCPPASSNQTDIDNYVAAIKRFEESPLPLIKVGRCGPVPKDEVRKLHLAHAQHHLSFLVPADKRAALHYAAGEQVAADIAKLRRGYHRVGNWTLPQAAWHLNRAIEYSMSPGPHPDPGPRTPEQEMTICAVLNSGSIPQGIESPSQAVPPADADPLVVDTFIETLKKFEQHPGPFAPHRRFGNLSVEETKKLALIHTAHHLSHLIPTAD